MCLARHFYQDLEHFEDDWRKYCAVQCYPWDCIFFTSVNVIVSPWSYLQKVGLVVALWKERKWVKWWDLVKCIAWWGYWLEIFRPIWLDFLLRQNCSFTCIKLNGSYWLVGWFHCLGILIWLDNFIQWGKDWMVTLIIFLMALILQNPSVWCSGMKTCCHLKEQE